MIIYRVMYNFNPLSANPTKCSNTLKQFVDNSQCLWLFLMDRVSMDFRVLLIWPHEMISPESS